MIKRARINFAKSFQNFAKPSLNFVKYFVNLEKYLLDVFFFCLIAKCLVNVRYNYYNYFAYNFRTHSLKQMAYN